MKSIHTLIADIYELLERRDGWFTDELASQFSTEVARRLQAQFAEGHSQRKTLRLSKMGNYCPRELWYAVNQPERAEKFPPWASNKFSYGHILEAWAITLARASGHNVEGEQDELIVDGIKGHRDCVIDGHVVDVKSCSSRQFEKLDKKTLADEDPFGYLSQLDGYVVGSAEDTLVTVKDTGFLLGIDKTLGHMVLYQHEVREQEIRAKIARYKDIVKLSEPPACACATEPEGASGNIKLGTKASYSSFKWDCFPGLRAFIYAKGPTYLTRVERLPNVPEINRHGKIITGY